ncbi:hypothetical protein MPTK1_3g12740 [Marchantia polymorpha subsp. ruderalis]|uniref:Protein kinase domain-containing protein n=2 Tax=Marchantia polymorpha TaxID=3197 RepID=A0AAF6B062_MARPO|nr:hypothetical protein MARPO_0050s0066 [Marchantia polymorpha]BBN05396.1 hypothetical protein Mp_3g12740 [Marchantia polymorpha subsp. ruderalis]|eukprot:PTQ38609.1 hypothetical protein MARPO_0050s0066 [Marchantia polymorpha]
MWSPGPQDNSSSSESEDAGEDGGQSAKSFLEVKVLKDGERIDQYYKVLDLIGEGRSGKVHEVVDVNKPDEKLAIKIQPKFDELGGNSPERELARLYKEMLICNRILPPHENVVQMKDFVVGKDKVYIVQELCVKKIDLFSFFGGAHETSARRVFKQLVSAVHLFHQYGVVHNDLQPHNVLFADTQFSTCRIIDFGLSIYKPAWAKKVHSNFKPYDWFKAEDLEGATDMAASSRYDIRALGKFLHAMMAGKHIPIIYSDMSFTMHNPDHYKPRKQLFCTAAFDLLFTIGPPPFGPELDDELPTIEEIRKHPWLVQGHLSRQHKIFEEEFTQLPEDFTVLEVLLKDKSTRPLRVIRDDLSNHYIITGELHRTNSTIGVMEGVDAKTKSFKKALRLLSKVDVTLMSAREARLEALRIYNELVITLRILPSYRNIVHISEVLLTEDYAMVVRELCGTQTLMEFFPVAKNHSARNIFKQLADAVQFLHRYGVVLVDLKPHHVAFMDAGFFSCKIIDMSSAVYNWELAECTHDFFQPGRFITPEVTKMLGPGNPEDDVRALGRILHAMMSGAWESNTGTRTLAPARPGFHKDALNLLSLIGPPPLGPELLQKTLSINEVCDHLWISPVLKPR